MLFKLTQIKPEPKFPTGHNSSDTNQLGFEFVEVYAIYNQPMEKGVDMRSVIAIVRTEHGSDSIPMQDIEDALPYYKITGGKR